MGVAAELLARARAAAPDETSQRILAAAVERFSAVGIRRTTVDDVAAAAGVGRATVYRRFTGRDELVRATVLRELAALLATVDAAVVEVVGADERLVEAFVVLVRAAREHALLGRLLDTEPGSVLPLVTTDGGPVLALCRDHLVELARTAPGGAAADVADPELVAEVLVRLCQSLLLTPHGTVDADDVAGLRRLAGATVRAAVRATPAGRPPARAPHTV